MSNTFVHTELAVDNVGRAKSFYKKLFKWKMQDLGPSMGNYTMVDIGSTTSAAGITAKMMPGQPSAWTPYVEVASVKKTMAKAEAAGAKVMVAYQPVGDMGALGIFMDPDGAVLGIWERGKSAPARKKKAKKKSAKKKSAKKKSAKKKSAKKKSAKKKSAKKKSAKKKSAKKKSAKKKSAKKKSAKKRR